MKNTIFLFLSFFCLLPAYAQQDEDEIIFKAMQDEIRRNKEQLALPGMSKPFFLSYALGQYRQFEVLGVLGSIVNTLEVPRNAAGAVQLLLGDYDRSSDISYSSPLTQVAIPGEMDYDVLRRSFWLGSDGMYKWSLQEMAGKEAFLKANPLKPEEEKLGDLIQAPAVRKIIEAGNPYTIDRKALEKMVCEVSAIFKDYKDIYNSMVMVSGFDSEIYKQTSAGVTTKQPLRYVIFSVQAHVMTADGERISDVFSVVTDRPEALPSVEELKKSVVSFADNLMKLREADKIEEDYSGPVLFEGNPCSSIFIGNLLNKGGLFAYRRPTNSTENYRSLSNRLGKKVIDERISIKNYTILEKYNETPLCGAYQIDAEGVIPAAQMTLVEEGVLKNLLNGSIPSPTAPQSTGSSRYLLSPTNLAYTTAPGTIHIQVKDGLERGKMKKALMKAAKGEGLGYAYIVRKFAGNASQIYRVDVKDGSEKLMRFGNISSVSLSEIEQVMEISSDENVFNYALNDQVLSSMICPYSILLEDIDIRRASVKAEKKPILKNPLQRN